MYDLKVFKKALKIILSKSLKPQEEFVSSSMIRYNEVTENLDVIGCAKIINELKVHFDGTIIKRKSVALELMFVKALKIIAEVFSYHNGDQKDQHWENTTKILKQLNISPDHERFIELRQFFSKKNWSEYIGEFKEGWFHGNGKMIFINGKIYDGRWEESRFLGK